MNKKLFLFAAIIAVVAVSSGTASAVGPERVEGFVCPVLNETVGAHNPNAVQIGGGDYSIIGPDVMIPLHATNGDGAGTPGGAHSSPGDSDYTAIWAN